MSGSAQRIKAAELSADAECRTDYTAFVKAGNTAQRSSKEKTPPELASDVSDRGIILTGGGSLLDGMDELIQERTGINTVTAENPASVVALGTGQYREVMNEFESQF